MKINIFSMHTEYLILRGRPTSIICDIIHSLEANPSQVFSVCKCDVETCSLECQTLTMDFTVKYERSCVQQLLLDKLQTHRLASEDDVCSFQSWS